MIKQQFYKRLRHELERKWKSIRSVTDWTVALYIIPALIFMGIYYRSLWINELSTEETIYFGLGLLAFYLVTYPRGVRSFLSKRIVYFNFVCNTYAKISPVWHDVHICSNSDNEYNSSRYYVTSVDEKYRSNRDTSPIILGILYYISIYVVVVNEICSCTCGETMGFMDCKNVVFSMSVSFLELVYFYL